MSPFPNWHPLVVHFPIALVLSAMALLLAARLLRSESVAASAATVGTWNLCLGAAAALVALGSGLSAVLGLDLSGAARQAISIHMKWAMLTTLLLVPDVHRLRDEVHWRPQFSLNEGLRDAIGWWRGQLGVTGPS